MKEITNCVSYFGMDLALDLCVHAHNPVWQTGIIACCLVDRRFKMHHYVKPVHALKHMQPVFSMNKSPSPPTHPHTHRQNNADSQMIGNLKWICSCWNTCKGSMFLPIISLFHEWCLRAEWLVVQATMPPRGSGRQWTCHSINHVVWELSLHQTELRISSLC